MSLTYSINHENYNALPQFPPTNPRPTILIHTHTHTHTSTPPFCLSYICCQFSMTLITLKYLEFTNRKINYPEYINIFQARLTSSGFIDNSNQFSTWFVKTRLGSERHSASWLFSIYLQPAGKIAVWFVSTYGTPKHFLIIGKEFCKTPCLSIQYEPTECSYFLSIYFSNLPLHISSRITAHHQEVLLCIYSNWYM